MTLKVAACLLMTIFVVHGTVILTKLNKFRISIDSIIFVITTNKIVS